MLITEAGLPPGADMDREGLSRLITDGTISHYELQPDRLILYIWSWKPEGSALKFGYIPRFAVHAKAAPVLLYDYYNPDERVTLAPEVFVVRQQKP